MKPKRFFFVPISVIVLLACSQCIPAVSSVPINTPTSKVTQTVTSTSTLSRLPTTTLTPASYTTLSSEEQQANIMMLLESNNSKCSLPCWWGITPGKTTQVEARQIFSTLRLDLHEYPQGFGKNSEINFPEGVVDVYFEFWVQNAYMNYIRITSTSYTPSNPASNIPAFKNMWANFAPEKVIPTLGIPSRIEVQIVNHPGEGQTTGVSHLLYLFYDSQGILLEYKVKSVIHSSYYIICPSFGGSGNTEDYIKIILRSPSEETPIENYDEAYNSSLVFSLEKAAGITPEEFYNLYLQTDIPICFNTLPGVFP